MGYVAKQLAQDEHLVFVTKLHPIIFAGPGAFGLFGLLFLTAEGGSGMGGFMLMIAVLSGLLTWLAYVSSEFAVTNRRVIIKVGVISRRTMETLLTKVEGVQVDQGILGRMLDYGTIQVTGTGGTKEPFKRIQQPLKFRQAVQDGASSSHVAAAQRHLDAIPGTPGQGDGLVSQLERLASLKAQGLLSEEEFAAQKGRILKG